MKRLAFLLLVALVSCAHDAAPKAAVEAGLPDVVVATLDAGSDAASYVAPANPGFIACGPTQCSPNGIIAQTCCIAGGVDTCQQASAACSGHRIACDETADCPSAQCCAEKDGDNLVTSCRANCITNVPRWQVCKGDSECESGACRTYRCGSGLPPLRFCQAPDGCTAQ